MTKQPVVEQIKPVVECSTIIDLKLWDRARDRNAMKKLLYPSCSETIYDTYLGELNLERIIAEDRADARQYKVLRKKAKRST